MKNLIEKIFGWLPFVKKRKLSKVQTEIYMQTMIISNHYAKVAKMYYNMSLCFLHLNDTKKVIDIISKTEKEMESNMFRVIANDWHKFGELRKEYLRLNGISK